MPADLFDRRTAVPPAGATQPNHDAAFAARPRLARLRDQLARAANKLRPARRNEPTAFFFHPPPPPNVGGFSTAPLPPRRASARRHAAGRVLGVRTLALADATTGRGAATRRRASRPRRPRGGPHSARRGTALPRTDGRSRSGRIAQRVPDGGTAISTVRPICPGSAAHRHPDPCAGRVIR